MTPSRGTIEHRSSGSDLAGHFSTNAILTIVAVVILGLFGGLFHIHSSDSEAAACCYCHAGLETPGGDLACSSTGPLFTVLRFPRPASSAQPAPLFQFYNRIPSAP